jgi:hypothetical protein
VGLWGIYGCFLGGFVGFFLRVCLGSSCKSFFSFSFFNKTPYYLSKKKKKRCSIAWWSIGAIIKGMGSPWTIFFYIVKLLVPFGLFSLVDLGCLGLCLDE